MILMLMLLFAAAVDYDVSMLLSRHFAAAAFPPLLPQSRQLFRHDVAAA